MGKIRKYIAVTVIFTMTVNCWAVKFTDVVDSELQRAIAELEEKKLFTKFIFQYGKEHFRPTAPITRSDMLLLLAEYEKISDALRSRQREILEAIKKVEDAQRVPAAPSVSLKEHQKMQEQLESLEKTLKGTNKKFEKLEKSVVKTTAQILSEASRIDTVKTPRKEKKILYIGLLLSVVNLIGIFIVITK